MEEVTKKFQNFFVRKDNKQLDLEKIFIVSFAYYLFLWKENFDLSAISEVLVLRFLISGYVFFYLTIYLYFSYCKKEAKVSKIKEIFLIQALYILVDYYLDYKNGDAKELMRLLVTEETKDAYLAQIANKGHLLFTAYPDLRPFVLSSLTSEVSAYQRERLEGLGGLGGLGEKLLNESKKKSLDFFLLLEKLLELQESVKDLAPIIQILDDILDIEEDKELRIFTYAQLRFQKEKVLDYLLLETIEKYFALSLQDKVLDCFLINFCIYILIVREKYFSQQLRTQLVPNSFFMNQEVEEYLANLLGILRK
jgi:hypothetical protein